MRREGVAGERLAVSFVRTPLTLPLAIAHGFPSPARGEGEETRDVAVDLCKALLAKEGLCEGKQARDVDLLPRWMYKKQSHSRRKS
jgi:hypothetical protein